MPVCPNCQERARPEDLRGEGDQLSCSGCRTPRLVLLPEAKMTDAPRTNTKQADKKLVDLQIFEVDGDHKLTLSIKMGSTLIHQSVSLESIKKFFTERKVKAGKAAT